MIGLKENLDQYLAAFEQLPKQPDWLWRIRQDAINQFAEIGFPTSRNEDWKYTNVAPIAKATWSTGVPPASVDEALKQLPFALPDSAVIFVDGRLHRKGAGGTQAVHNLWNGSAVREHFTHAAPVVEQPFVALNTALASDAACVVIPKGTAIEQPVYVVFVSTAGAASYPRVLVVAGDESQATIVEVYVQLGDGAPFTNAVTEIFAGESASVEHYKIQRESERAFHISNLYAHQARSSNLLAHSVSIGGGLVRNDVTVVMDGEGGECTLNGLYVLRGEQHVDNHTTLDHAKPHCASREYYKGVLDGSSSGVFNGGIVVRQDAQKTDAIQSNKNLLLSADAIINTKPQLQIWADDVRCTHGATVGQIDADLVFYLQSRGIGREEARRLLTFAFASDVLGRMKVEPVRAGLEKEMFARLA